MAQTATNNISSVPGFVMSYDPEAALNPYHYHLDYDSVCVDVGDANGVYDGQRDIDKQFRVLDGDGDDESVVDMGADEYCDEGESNDADFNDDGIVAYYDFSVFADTWLTSLGEEDYNPYCDLYEDDYIDYGDFAVFANDWLWQACWKNLDQGFAMMMGMGGGGESMMSMPIAMDSMVIESPAPEPTLEERIEQIEEAIDFFNEVLKDEEVKETIDLDNLQKLINDLEKMLEELESEKTSKNSIDF